VERKKRDKENKEGKIKENTRETTTRLHYRNHFTEITILRPPESLICEQNATTEC
jgi:hypothetical protein